MLIERVNYGGWANSYRMTNGEVELVVTSDVGPRVIRYGFLGGQNLFKEFAGGLGKSDEATWQARGGHRIWIAPEVGITYALDNGPVRVETADDTLTATQPVEKESGLEKQIAVKMAASGSGVEVTHRITNRNTRPIELAPWALTMMAAGGLGITGLPPRGTHPEMLAPTNPLVMWAFTDLSDPRWKFTRKYIVLRQGAGNGSPQKIGLFNADTWGAYLLGSELFVKRCAADSSKAYADLGSSFETFTNGEMLELETLGPLTKLDPGATVQHVERWSLHRPVQTPEFDDPSLDRVFLPLLR